MAPVTATGVPKPDAPSKNAPNENAINRSCNLRSFVTPTNGVLQYREYAFLHRQPVEKDDIQDNPTNGKEAGNCAEHGRTQRHARRQVKTKMATRLATIKAMIAAQWAFTLLDAMRTKRVTTGSAATIVESAFEFSGS
jgi:hypothetical protein